MPTTAVVGSMVACAVPQQSCDPYLSIPHAACRPSPQQLNFESSWNALLTSQQSEMAVLDALVTWASGAGQPEADC